MMNKILLALIAVGLWANALESWTRPARADNSESYLSDIRDDVSQISADVNALANGGNGCRNTRICD